jgi:hypothetical protein
MQYFKQIKPAYLLLILPLCGCAVAWGQDHKIEFASSSSITINYDPSLTNMGEVQNVAQEHCSKYKKDAVPQGNSTSPWGMTNISFLCVKRS